MTSADPVDLRLLSLLAESGRAAVHEMAARLGMDPREVATRLVSLSATGLPLIVGVECDQARLQGMLAQQQRYQGPPQAYPAQPPSPGQPAPAFPVQQPQQYPQPPQAPGTAGQPQASPAGAAPPGLPPTPSGPHPAPGPPSGPTPQSAQPGQPGQLQDPVNTWGPPQSASWARGDQPPQASAAPVAATGRVGDTVRTTGLGGEPIGVRLVEVVDPADSLLSAAGYTLGANERAVIVHTELTNNGAQPYTALPDLYLVLHTADGHSVGKAPISLSSRPPHTIGVDPGQTVGGHAVYVLHERTRVIEVRWLARPDAGEHAVTWEL